MLLAHELIRHSATASTAAAKETMIFFHGLLGRKQNLRSFAKRCLPNDNCQALLVDVRGHGESYNKEFPPPHTLEACAQDVSTLVSTLLSQGQIVKMPSAVVGHSFGGKLALEYFLRNTNSVELTWVLDSAPGLINYHLEGEDPQEQRESVIRLIGVLDTLPPFANKAEMTKMLLERNFSPMVANWMTTNVVQHNKWGFNLKVVKELFADYSKRDFVPALRSLPAHERNKIHFLRAGRNKLLWTESVLQEMESGVGNVHVMPNAGHFLHASDPDGVLAVMQDSLDSWSSK